MSSVENGVIQTLSVSQLDSFDREQPGGCENRWWLERPMQLRPDQTDAQGDGEKAHALLAAYFTDGVIPMGRVKMGTAVRGAIAKGKLPKPGPDLIVEWRLSDQEKYDAAGNYIPLDVDAAPKIGGVPFDGFIDLSFRRGPIPTVLDHKFYGDIDADAIAADVDAETGETSLLIKTNQTPIYALAQMPYWPDATHWRLVLHYVNKTSVDKAPHSFFRWQIVTTEQLLKRRDEIAATVERMKIVARAQDQTEVPFNRKACHAWWGCPHQSICSAFMENKLENLSDEELALLDGTPPSAALDDEFAGLEDAHPPEPEDELAALEREHAEKVAALQKAKAAAAKPAGPKRDNMKIREVPAPGDVPPPQPKPPAKAPVEPTCKPCGAMLTPENASQLQSGAWKHIGCPKDATPPAATTPAPRARKTTGTTPPPATPAALTDAATRAKTSITLTLEFASAADAIAALQLLGK